MTVASWVEALAALDEVTLSSTTGSRRLAGLFSLDLQGPQVPVLQNDQWDAGADAVAAVNANPPLNGDWPGLTELAKAYLLFCRDVDPGNVAASFDAYAAFFAALQAAYSGTNGAALNIAVQHATRTMVRDFGRQRAPALWMAGVLLRVFNSIRSDKAAPNPASASVPGGTKRFGPQKAQIGLFVATVLCRLYFWAGRASQAAYVFNNIQSAARSLTAFPMAQQVEFRYWLGRFHLTRGELHAAVHHLRWAYDRCPPQSPNKLRILLHLLVPSTLVGRPPSRLMVEGLSLVDPLGTLLSALRRPSWPALQQLETHPWVVSLRIGHLLRNHGRALVARRVLVRLVKIAGQPDRLYLEDVLAAFRLAGLVGPADAPAFLETEGLCIALINHGYLKANLNAGLQVLRLRPRDPLPALLGIHKAHLERDGERWMDE